MNTKKDDLYDELLPGMLQASKKYLEFAVNGDMTAFNGMTQQVTACKDVFSVLVTVVKDQLTADELMTKIDKLVEPSSASNRH